MCLSRITVVDITPVVRFPIKSIFFICICMVSNNVWCILSDNMMFAIRLRTWGHGTLDERQLKAMVQWIELNRVCISLELAIGISCMGENKRHIWGVSGIFLPEIRSIMRWDTTTYILGLLPFFYFFLKPEGWNGKWKQSVIRFFSTQLNNWMNIFQEWGL